MEFKRITSSTSSNHNYWFNIVAVIAIFIAITIIVAFFHYSLNTILKTYVRGISSYLLRLNSLYISSEIWRRSIITFFKKTLTEREGTTHHQFLLFLIFETFFQFLIFLERLNCFDKKVWFFWLLHLSKF